MATLATVQCEQKLDRQFQLWWSFVLLAFKQWASNGTGFSCSIVSLLVEAGFVFR